MDKMTTTGTIATLYRTLSASNYYTLSGVDQYWEVGRQLLQPEYSLYIVSFIRRGVDEDRRFVEDLCPEKLLDIFKCMSLPGEILENAQHFHYRELVAAAKLNEENEAYGPVPERPNWLAWMNNKLNDGFIYEYSFEVLVVKMRGIRRMFGAVRELPFEEAYEIVLRHDQSGRERRERRLREEERLRLIFERHRRDVERHRLANEITQRNNTNQRTSETVTREVLEEVFDREQSTLEDILVKFQHAEDNNSVRIDVHNNEHGKPSILFLPKDKMADFMRLLVVPATDNVPCCQICNDAAGQLGCGRTIGKETKTRCAGSMCLKCFHACFLMNTKCPFCRQDYVPLAKRTTEPTTEDNQKEA